jgi:hypothetical protein
MFNNILITDYTRNEHIECKTKKEYKDYLKIKPDATEIIGGYGQQIKPIFDIDAYKTDINKDEINKIILSLFPDKKTVYASRIPRETDKGLKYSYRFYVLGVRITAKNLHKLIIDAGFDKKNIFDLSIYKYKGLLYLPFTTKKKDNKAGGLIDVPELTPINCDLFDCCASYIAEDYEDWDIKMPKVEKVEEIKKVEEVEDENDGDNVDINKLYELITKLKKHRATEFNDWINGCWAIINICKKNNLRQSKIYELVHLFSALDKDAYNEDGIDDWLIDNYKRTRPNGYGWKFLLNWLKDDNKDFYDKLTFKYISYDELKTKFEENNFKLIDRSSYAWIDSNKKIHYHIRKNLKSHYENLYFYEKVIKKVKKEEIEILEKVLFVDKWLKDENIRTYEHVDFIPYDIFDATKNKNIYNLWGGFRAEKYKPINDDLKINELMEPIIHHLIDVLSGDNYIYILQYLASIIQRPSKPTGVIILLAGLQGTGKGTIIDNFRKYILGDELSSQSEGLTPIFDRFSSVMENKLLVQADEISMGEFLSNNIKEKIKNRTTIDKIQNEKKCIDPTTINNYVNFIFTTNNDNSVVIPYDDRRFCVFKATEKYLRNTEYFDKLHDYLKREDVSRAFYEYLKNLDISHITNFQNIRPKSEYYNEMVRLNLSPFHRYLSYLSIHNEQIDIKNNYDYDPDDYICKTAMTLYSNYIDWCGTRNFSKEFKYTNTKFGLEMKKLTDIDEAIIKKQTTMNAIYIINKDKLKNLLISKKLFDEDTY